MKNHVTEDKECSACNHEAEFDKMEAEAKKCSFWSAHSFKACAHLQNKLCTNATALEEYREKHPYMPVRKRDD